MMPKFISPPKMMQPRQSANTDSNVAAITMNPTNTYAAVVAPNPKCKISALTDDGAPRPR